MQFQNNPVNYNKNTSNKIQNNRNITQTNTPEQEAETEEIDFGTFVEENDTKGFDVSVNDLMSVAEMSNPNPISNQVEELL